VKLLTLLPARPGTSMTVNEANDKTKNDLLASNGLSVPTRPVSPACFKWEFAEPAVQKELHVDSLNWAEPATISGAELIKENSLRQVWRINLAGRQYYAKLYLRSGVFWQIKRYLRGPVCIKEWTVARFALLRGINCINPLAYAVSCNPTHPVDSLLITVGIANSQPLTDYWQNLTSQTYANIASRIAFLEDALAELLARAHQAGLAHSDLHPGNLLIEPKPGEPRPIVRLVDLHSVRVGKAVSDREAVYNLAQLNQWFRQNATLTQRMRLLKRYMEYRKILADHQNDKWSGKTFKFWAAELDRAVRRHAEKLLASRDRRIMRRGKYYDKFNLQDYWQVHVFLKTKHPLKYSPSTYMEFSTDQWKKTLKSPQAILDEFVHHARPIKSSRSTLVCRGTLHVGEKNLAVVVKRQVRKKPLAAIWDCLRNSRSLRAWKMSFAMIHRGLPVAHPLAVLERRIGPYLTSSIFITEEVKPSISLRAFLTSVLPVLSAEKRRAIKLVLLDQLATLLRKMHQNNFTHRDMKGTNILIHNMPMDLPDDIDPADLKVVLVDLDGLGIKFRPSVRDQLRPLVRLSYSADLSSYITLTDRARFLKNYLTCYGSGLPDWKSLWRKIQTEREKNSQNHIAG